MILTSENNLFHKVFPKIIEDRLLKTRVIQSISIVGKPSLQNTNDLVAFVVLANGVSKETAIQALSTYAQGKLNRYERPVQYIVMEQLPLTSVGKVDYRTLEKEAEKI